MPLALATIAQTHALLVGYLDLSVGSMISFGVVVGSFLIGADASTFEILTGIAVILACGLGLGLVNAVLIRGLKIPSLIATLATLSILDGISLTMRPTAQGVISDDLVSFLRTSVGPIPIAFVVIVIGAGLLDLWLHGSGSGLRGAGGRVRRPCCEAGRDQDQLDPGARAHALGRDRRDRGAVRHGPLADRQRSDRELVHAQQHHRRRAWAAPRSPAAERPSSAARWRPFCSRSSSPHSRSSDWHPPTAR